MVPVAGLEPAHHRWQWILSPPRLPIPTHRHFFSSRFIILDVAVKCKRNLWGFRQFGKWREVGEGRRTVCGARPPGRAISLRVVTPPIFRQNLPPAQIPADSQMAPPPHAAGHTPPRPHSPDSGKTPASPRRSGRKYTASPRPLHVPSSRPP